MEKHKLRKIRVPDGIEPTTLRDLVGRSNHVATRDSMVRNGQFVGLDWNRTAGRHS